MVAVLDVPRGRFYGPCSGQDLPIAFELFGDTINRFTFCDLGYRGPNTTAKEAVPENWTLASRIQGVDEALPEKTTWYSRNRPFRPRSSLETWRRPDGSEVLVELRYDLAQDVLTEQFAPGSVAAFMHINDGAGEGGSDLWFLASHSELSGDPDQGNRLLRQVASRLAKGAVIVTDASLTDAEFQHDASFERAGRRWELIGQAPNKRIPERRLRLWRALGVVNK